MGNPIGVLLGDPKHLTKFEIPLDFTRKSENTSDLFYVVFTHQPYFLTRASMRHPWIYPHVLN